LQRWKQETVDGQRVLPTRASLARGSWFGHQLVRSEGGAVSARSWPASRWWRSRSRRPPMTPPAPSVRRRRRRPPALRNRLP